MSPTATVDVDDVQLKLLEVVTVVDKEACSLQAYTV